jgi:hypothetical protein
MLILRGQASARGGASSSAILLPTDAPFDGIIGRTHKDSKLSLAFLFYSRCLVMALHPTPITRFPTVRS